MRMTIETQADFELAATMLETQNLPVAIQDAVICAVEAALALQFVDQPAPVEPPAPEYNLAAVIAARAPERKADRSAAAKKAAETRRRNVEHAEANRSAFIQATVAERLAPHYANNPKFFPDVMWVARMREMLALQWDQKELEIKAEIKQQRIEEQTQRRAIRAQLESVAV